MSIKTRTKSAIPYSVAISVLNVLVALFGMILLVRYLPPIEYGAYAILNGMVPMLNLFISFGYDQYLFRYIPSLEDNKQVGYVVWHIVGRRVVIATAITLLLILTFNYFDDSIGLNGFFLHFAIFQIIVVLSIGNTILKQAFLIRLSQDIVFGTNVVYELSRVAVVVVGINQQEEFLFFIIGFAACETLFTVLSSFFFVRNYGFPGLKRIIRKREETPDEKAYRKASYIDKLGGSFLGTDIDRYILAYFSNNVQVAIYAISTRILTKFLKFYPHLMFKHIFEVALYTKFDASQRDSDINRSFSIIYNANNIVSFLAIAIFVPLGREMLDFALKQEYTQQAYLPICIFLVFLIFNSIPLGMVAKTIKKPKILLIARLSTVVNLGVGIPMAYQFGAVGMALATTLSQFLQKVIIYFLLKKHIDLKLQGIATLKSVVNCVVTIGILYLIDQYTPTYTWLLFLKIAVGLGLYLLLMKFNSVFSAEDKERLLTLLPKKLQKPAGYVL
ncbi:oligosaccharide flippase family protein [Tunicatimonas pelagia]|uniref:oligosaccharide flippase family protein n=1 Tax=Tunicatimonas pelagia TaxID=931531 RepID=UPI0026651070|nr:polysaccharide biosynthesis C-terminal domain-containing protein [Tunicatimonas pelagia]WKN41968.1 polysaccharide biosynthesis C-terminal domain-containing protein [Tunicatimonas pelagia]